MIECFQEIDGYLNRLVMEANIVCLFTAMNWLERTKSHMKCELMSIDTPLRKIIKNSLSKMQ